MNMTTVLRYLLLLILMSDMTSGQGAEMADYVFRKTEVAVFSPATHAAIFEVSTRSKLDCAETCAADQTCSAFGYSKSGKVCYVFNDALNMNMAVEISSEIADVTFYNLSLCENGGQRLRETCVCSEGYVGQRCERLMSDCSEGYDEGITETGVYQIRPDAAPYPFEVKCVMNTTGQTVVQWHHNANFSFNKTWAEFRIGFGNRDGDHWIGNERLYWLTHSRNFSLRVSIKSQTGEIHNFNGGRFIIDPEDDSFSIGVYENPDSNTCLSSYNGDVFSTYDRVGNSTNCAALNGSGWWHSSSCSYCNLNGKLYTGNGTITGPAVWNSPNATTIEHILQTEMTLVLLQETTDDPMGGFTTQFPSY